MTTPSPRIRREPPPFRRVRVVRTEAVTPHMARVVLAGPELEGFRVDEPAASVRLLLPSDGMLVVPGWAGNEFLLPDGRRPVIRTFTPRRFDAGALELHLDIVLHSTGAATAWVTDARPGEEVAVSGVGRGYAIDPEVRSFTLIGDETAIPAICQLLESLPDVEISTRIEVSHEDAGVDLHRDVDAEWFVLRKGSPRGDTLVSAVRDMDPARGGRIWAAGEAASMQRIRKLLFEDRGLARSDAHVRGYWKDGRSGE